MDWVEFTGKTVDDALTEALISLETTSDKVEWDVVEKESRGVLGLFSRPAKIRLRLKEEEKSVVEEVNVKEEIQLQRSCTIDSNIAKVAKSFLESIFKEMKVTAEIQIDVKEDNELDINLIGEDMGVLIGKRGQTLDSLQYLTSLVVNKESSIYVKVKLDTENYRERRKETLENLAKNIAYKVKRSKHPVSLEPMNPYERRIIHSALQYDKFVDTHSEGDEPYRRVVVTLKSNVRDHGNRHYNKNYYHSNGNNSRYRNNSFKSDRQTSDN